MAYTKIAIKETIKDVWEEPDGSTAYSTNKEEVEVHFKDHKEYINKVLVKVLSFFYNGDFNSNTAFNLIYDFEGIESTIEEEFKYEINEILMNLYYEEKLGED